MVQQLLPLLPHDIGQAALAAALFGTLVGVGLWLAGARFSRPMITLLGVSLGAILGRALPGWMSWNLNTMAASVGGAVVLGMSGYVLHRVWVGLGLGLVLACWAVLATWTFAGESATPTWPAVDAGANPWTFAAAAWENVPLNVRKLLPYACGSALISGFLPALLWPRAAVVLLYSALGTSLLVGMGLIAVENGRPDWITVVPAHSWAQVTTLLGFVAFGAVVQWGSKKPEASSQEPEQEGA